MSKAKPEAPQPEVCVPAAAERTMQVLAILMRTESAYGKTIAVNPLERGAMKTEKLSTTCPPRLPAYPTFGVGERIHFEYEPGNYFACYLNADGALTVRASGSHSDLLATHHHVSNDTSIVARRWDNNLKRHVDFVIAEAK